MTTTDRRVCPFRLRNIAYWSTTAVLAAEGIVGGITGGLRLLPFHETATRLGYPDYFLSLLSVCYMLAGLVLLAPRLPRLKEWAYAGLAFTYTGAVASHIAVGDDAKTLVAPTVFLALTAASWALRPPARRDLPPTSGRLTRGRAAVYWIATVAVAGELAVGGVWDLARIDYVRDVVEHLGYPAYLLTIMGIWKVPGAVALLIPRFARLKEWVYAGAAINYAFAVASHVAVGDEISAVVAPAALLVLTATSWVLSLRARTVGARGCVRVGL